MDLSDSKVRRRVNKAFREQGIPAKVCGKCFVVKGHGAFHFDNRRGAPKAVCKPCQSDISRTWSTVNRERKSETDRRWLAANRERKAETNRRWEVQNRERRAEAIRRWRESNRERVAATNHRWLEQNRERKDETNRRWAVANRERVQETSRRWYKENRERAAENSRRWCRANPDKVRAKDLRRRATIADATTEDFTARDLRHDWEDHDLYACFFCGGSLLDGYEVEHFYALSKGGPHALFNLVPSCAPCNRGVGGKGTKEPWAFLHAALVEQGVDLAAVQAGIEAVAARRRS